MPPLLRTALLASIALLAACGGDKAAPSADGAATGPAADGGGTLHVFNWSDYIAEDTVAQFQTATGMTVNYDVYSGNEILVKRLAAAPTAYDVVFPSARPTAQDLVNRGQLLTLDKSKLPNLRNLDPGIMADLANIDPGNRHLIPYLWGTTGIGVNVAKVREALGQDATLDSWDLVFDPATTAKLSSCGIGVLDDNVEVTSALMIWLGRNADDHGDEAMAAARDALMAIRPNVRKITGSAELNDDLASGDLCVVLNFSGDVIQARDTAKESNGPEIRYLLPREGAVRWVDVVAIPKGARNPDGAHRFLNFLMEPKTIAGITNYVAYANANTAATALIDPEIAGDQAIYPPKDVSTRLRGVNLSSAEGDARQKQVWNAFVFGDSR